MKIIVTGATGFIGRHVTDLLLAAKHEVVIITRKPGFELPGATVVAGDISDIPSIEPAFAGADVLVNLAAEIKDEAKFAQTNITGVRHLCQLVNKYKIPKVVHLSSVGVQGMQFSRKYMSVDENYPHDPKNGYEKTKLESEKIWQSQLNDTTVLYMLRPTNVFGEQHPRKALLNLIRRSKQGKTFYISRKAVANYVYVGDLVHAIAKCIDAQGESKRIHIFNVGYAVKLADMLTAINHFTMGGARIKFIPAWLYVLAAPLFSLFLKSRKGVLQSLFNRVAYNDAALTHTMHYPFGLLKGLQHTVQYYQQNNMLA